MKALQRGTDCSVPVLEKAIREWLDNWNDDPRPFVWTKSADEIFSSLSKYLQRTSLPGHQLSASSAASTFGRESELETDLDQSALHGSSELAEKEAANRSNRKTRR